MPYRSADAHDPDAQPEQTSPTSIERGRPSYSWRYGQDRRLEMVRRYVDLDGARILDVGCGIGTYVRRFRQYSGRRPRHRGGAGARGGGQPRGLPNIVLAVGEALPYPDDHFDLVFSNEVIEHVDDDRRDRRGDGARDEARRPHRGLRAQPAVPLRDPRRLRRRALRVRQHPARQLAPGPAARPLRPARAGLHAGRASGASSRASRCASSTTASSTRASTTSPPATPAWGAVLRRALYVAEHTPLHAFGLSHFLVVRKSGARAAAGLSGQLSRRGDPPASWMPPGRARGPR